MEADVRLRQICSINLRRLTVLYCQLGSCNVSKYVNICSIARTL